VVVHALGEDRRTVQELVGDAQRARAHGFVEQVAAAVTRLGHGRLDRGRERPEVAGQVASGEHGFDRGAALVAEHDDELAAQVLDRVLDRADARVVEHSRPRSARRRDRRGPGRRRARVTRASRRSHDHGERLLVARDLAAAFQRLVQALGLAAHEALVARAQSLEGTGSWNRSGVPCRAAR
jgi:hypothetical protein